jgi:hypothetical protein
MLIFILGLIALLLSTLGTSIKSLLEEILKELKKR